MSRGQLAYRVVEEAMLLLTITIPDIPAIIKKANKEVLLIAQRDSTVPANRLDAFE